MTQLATAAVHEEKLLYTAKAHTSGIGSTTIATLREGARDGGRWFGRATLLLLAGTLAIGLPHVPANAETPRPPSRIANIYNGFHHQPTRSETERRERAAGLRPSAHQQSSEDAVLQQLYQRLRQAARTG